MPTESKSKVLKSSPRGGYLLARVDPVHTHGCPAWRMAKSHGPCNCGAHELADQWAAAQGTADPFSGIKPF